MGVSVLGVLLGVIFVGFVVAGFSCLVVVFLVGFVWVFLERKLFIRINRLCCLNPFYRFKSSFSPSLSLKLPDDFVSSA